MATKHTSNYQLHLWEPGDSFLREEFNENSEKVDGALGETAAAATAALEASPSIKLMEWTMPASANKFSIDVSSLDLREYQGIRVYLEFCTNYDSVEIHYHCNDTTEVSTNYWVGANTSGGWSFGAFRSQAAGPIPVVWELYPRPTGIFSRLQGVNQSTPAVGQLKGAAQLRKLNFYMKYNPDGLVIAGSKAAIWGIR